MEIYGLNKLIFCGFLYVEGNLTCRRDGLNISWPSHHVSLIIRFIVHRMFYKMITIGELTYKREDCEIHL